jgi:hypothetical protein
MIILFSLVSTMPTFEEVDYLIDELEYCIEIHQWYIDNDYHPEYTGDDEWHMRWVDTYNRTIIVLNAYKRLARWMR